MVSLQMCAVETREGRVPTVGHGDASPRRRNALYQRVLSVEVRGIEPLSSSDLPGLLRA